VAFALPNKLRDRKFAEGHQEYDPNVITYEDMTDKQNLHFRYLSEWLQGVDKRWLMVV